MWQLLTWLCVWLQQGAFDAAAYSFFGDMAPLDDGLGGALEVSAQGSCMVQYSSVLDKGVIWCYAAWQRVQIMSTVCIHAYVQPLTQYPAV